MQSDSAHQPERILLEYWSQGQLLPFDSHATGIWDLSDGDVDPQSAFSADQCFSLAKDRLSSTYYFRGRCGILGQPQHCAIIATVGPLTDNRQTVGLKRRL